MPRECTHDEAMEWDRRIEDAGPASLLLAIESRLGPRLRSSITSDDIFQEVLLRAWRARGDFTDQGRRAFRAWLLTLADRCIRDAADHFGAVKRGGRVTTFSMNQRGREGGSAPSVFAGPAMTTTPSRVVSYQEEAARLRLALDSLPRDDAELIRLRIIEQRPIAMVAEQLGIGVSAARHRLRRVAHEWQHALASVSQQDVREFPLNSATPPGTSAASEDMERPT